MFSTGHLTLSYRLIPRPGLTTLWRINEWRQVSLILYTYETSGHLTLSYRLIPRPGLTTLWRINEWHQVSLILYTYETVHRISVDINYANEPVYQQQRRSLFDILIVWDFLVLGLSVATLSWRVESYKPCTHLKYYRYTSSIIIYVSTSPILVITFYMKKFRWVFALVNYYNVQYFLSLFFSKHFFSKKMLSCNS